MRLYSYISSLPILSHAKNMSAASIIQELYLHTRKSIYKFSIKIIV